jgi:hypothetical protein
MVINEPGEYYAVCCPYCGDTRFRLYINHMFGVRDDRSGDSRLHLAHCFNESCIDNREAQLRLKSLLETNLGSLTRCTIRQGEVKVMEEAERALPPGEIIPLENISPDHVAVRYLRSRRFDLDYLSKFYKVGWCEKSMYSLARKRIYIPLFWEGRLRGWQARYPGEINWKKKGAPPKYFTMPGTPRRKLIYNFSRALNYETGVLVEGVTDVWRFGAMAMATLGDTTTQDQLASLLSGFRSASLVLLYDPEAVEKDSTKELIAKLQAANLYGGVAVVKLPEGTDPGSLSREFLRQYVADAASKQGVRVLWQRRRVAESG